MRETWIYEWTDRAQFAYAILRLHGRHWRAEWGFRDPPGSDNVVQQGEHETSVLEDVLQTMLEHVRAMATDPDEVVKLEKRLRATLKEVEFPSH